MKKNIEIPKPDETQDYQLLGPDEDIDIETAEEILASYNINCDDLVNDLKVRIKKQLKDNSENKNKEIESENLAKVLRDILNYQRANDPKQIEPNNLIKGFLDGTIQQKLKPSWDFRNKSKDGISENDQQLLKDLETGSDED